MGTSCVGKGKKLQPKKSDNKSNTLSSEMQSSEEIVLHRSKEIRLPIISLLPYRRERYLMPLDFKIYREQLKFEKEYRYQELLDFNKDKFISSCTISHFSSKKIEEPIPETGWNQCSNLQRQFYPSQAVVLLNGNAYIKLGVALIQQQKQNENRIQMVNEAEIQLRFAEEEVYPKQILLVNLESNEQMSLKINQRCYDIIQHEDVQVIVKEVLESHPHFQYFYTPYLNGIAFTQKIDSKLELQGKPHFLADLFSLKKQLTSSTVMLLYTNKAKPSRGNGQYLLKGKMTKYFEISNYIKQHFQDIWHSDMKQLQLVVEREKLNGYLAIQFLRCVVDSLERAHLGSGKYLEKRQDLTEKREKLIQHFIFLEKGIVRMLQFLINAFLVFQGVTDSQQTDDRIKQIQKSIACELPLILDGLFHEFGYEINEKEHYYKLQSFYFVKYRHHKKIRHLNKNILFPHCEIINRIKVCMMKICSNQNITQDFVVKIRCQFLEHLQVSFKQQMTININLHFVQDFFIRLKLIQIYLSIMALKNVEGQWRKLQDQINSIEYIAPETMLFYFALGGIISTSLKLNLERTQAEEYYYLKSLELAHKMYGDPRTNRSNMPIERQQIWQLLILQSYSSLFKGAFEKKEFHYLNNIHQCLREDLKAVFPSTEVMQEENPQKKFAKMLEYLPVRTFSGIFYKRSMIFDSENDDLRSNYSESLSSSSSKRTNRTSYKINESEFSLKLSLYSGVIRWGHNIAGPPHILPPLKNKQVIAISSGNYHTVFLTQSGIFGWGQNYSSQLGVHNQEKIYLKEIICILAIQINRNKDRYQISCGNQHTAVLINGSLFMWGQAEGGILAGNGHVFDYISCGGLHTLAIREGVVYSWGRGEGGQLGHPLSALNQKKKQESTQYFIDVPTPIKTIPSLAIKVACGDAHSLVLTSQGKVYVFGFCYQGQLGLGLTGQNQNFQIFEPQQQNYFKQRIIDIYAGPTFSFFKTERQEVFSCGINDCLQLGIDRVLKVFQKKKYLNRTVELNRRKLGEQQFSKPRRIDMFNNQVNLNLVHLECGENHCLALVKYMGQEVMLMGWGLNKNFQIDSQLNQTTTPRTLDSFYSLQISQICCGSTYSLATIGKILMTDEQLLQFLEDIHLSDKSL